MTTAPQQRKINLAVSHLVELAYTATETERHLKSMAAFPLTDDEMAQRDTLADMARDLMGMVASTVEAIESIIPDISI